MSAELVHVINLDQHQHLFRDEAAYHQFTQILSASLQQDLRPIICEQRVIGATLSPGATKDYLYERMVRKIAERPELLAELTDRIENDEIVA